MTGSAGIVVDVDVDEVDDDDDDDDEVLDSAVVEVAADFGVGGED